MKIKILLAFCHILIVTKGITSDVAQAGQPSNAIQDSHISRGFGTSNGGAFTVTSSIAETVIGTSSNGGFIVHSGLLKPSATTELIFTNSFE